MVPPRHSAGPAPLRVPGSARRTSSIDVSWPDGRAGNLALVGRARDFITPASGGVLDDLSGTSLVSGWAWSQWDKKWLTTARSALKGFDLEKAFRSRLGICAGFAEGSSGLDPHTDRSGTPAPDLRNPDDLDGWHRLTDQAGAVGMRRARRIDVRLDGRIVMIDAAFQDSATTPAGGRGVVHEYTLRAAADAQSLRVSSVEAEPRVLPFVECPSAAENLWRLLGTPLPELREKVLAELRGTACCTHLNDALRALAEVPALAEHLRRSA